LSDFSTIHCPRSVVAGDVVCLDGCCALEWQCLVVVVVVSGAVKVSLQGGSLSDLNQNLVHNVVGDISGEHIKDETVSTSEGQVVKSPCLHTSHQDGPGEVRYADSGSSVDEAKDGDDGEDQPPHPQDKEVLLVEEIVG